MKNGILTLLLCVGASLPLCAALPEMSDGGLINRAPRRDMVKDAYRIALTQVKYYDWESGVENPDDYYFTEVLAPSFSVTSVDDGVIVNDFYNGLSLPIYTEVGDNGNTMALIPSACLLFNDSVIGEARSRVDTVRFAVLGTWSWMVNGDYRDFMGTVNDDGSIVFSGDDNDAGFLFYQEEIHRTYKLGRLMKCDTVVTISPVFTHLELVNANGVHDFQMAFYIDGINPLTEDDIDNFNTDDPDSGDPTPDNPNDSTPSTPTFPGHGKSHLLNGAVVLSDYTTAETFGVGSSGKPIKPGNPVNPKPWGFSVMSGDNSYDTLDDYKATTLSSCGNPNDSDSSNVVLGSLKPSHQEWGVGPSGRGIKPNGDPKPANGSHSRVDNGNDTRPLDNTGSTLMASGNPNGSGVVNQFNGNQFDGEQGEVGRYRPDDGVCHPQGVGSNGKPIKPNNPKPSISPNGFAAIDMKDYRPDGRFSLSDYLNGTTINAMSLHVDSLTRIHGLPTLSLTRFASVNYGYGVQPMGVGPGKGGPIKPDRPSRASAVGRGLVFDCSAEVFIRPVGDNEIIICNLFGNGRVNYITLNEDGFMSLPKQVIASQRGTGDDLYNYYAPNADINELTPGNIGRWTADSIYWGTTIPSTDLEEANTLKAVIDPSHWHEGDDYFIDEDDVLPLYYNYRYIYRGNTLRFTDGQQFGLDNTVMFKSRTSVNDIERVINGMIDGNSAYSIEDVTRMIDQMLNNQ